MKHLLPFGLGLASALALVGLSSMSSPAAPQELPGGIREGSVVFAFNLMKGSLPALPGLTVDTPVTLREVNKGWVLIDYPGIAGTPPWINVDTIISYRITR